MKNATLITNHQKLETLIMNNFKNDVPKYHKKKIVQNQKVKIKQIINIFMKNVLYNTTLHSTVK